MAGRLLPCQPLCGHLPRPRNGHSPRPRGSAVVEPIMIKCTQLPDQGNKMRHRRRKDTTKSTVNQGTNRRVNEDASRLAKAFSCLCTRAPGCLCDCKQPRFLSSKSVIPPQQQPCDVRRTTTLIRQIPHLRYREVQ